MTENVQCPPLEMEINIWMYYFLDVMHEGATCEQTSEGSVLLIQPGQETNKRECSHEDMML